MSAERMTEERLESLCASLSECGVNAESRGAKLEAEARRARAAEKAMWDALMKAQWAFRHRCNGCDCQRVAAEAVDAVLEAHEVGNG